MAEIGLIASIVQIIGAGTSLSIAIFDVAATIGNAENDLQNIGMEVSLLCSVLKQVQGLLEPQNRHFKPSTIAVESAQKIIGQCHKVFREMAAILAPFRTMGDNDVFPAADVDFVSRVKWAFSRKPKIALLRSTLESCKLTLIVMLNTMQLAERVSQRRQSSVSTMQEDEHDKAMTQSLLISQQYAVARLEHCEEKVEKAEELDRDLPGETPSSQATSKKQRRRSRGRLMQMFSGLRIETEVPSPNNPRDLNPTLVRERTSVWLEDILAPSLGPGDVHPGKLRQKRLSSVGTANAPLELLRKWTDQGAPLSQRPRSNRPQEVEEVDNHIWRDSKFSFQVPPLPRRQSMNAEPPGHILEFASTQISSDYISPKTGRVHSVGYHRVAGVNGALHMSREALLLEDADSYDAIARLILEEHNADMQIGDVALCVSFGGKTKVLKRIERPLEVLKDLEELELEPRLFLRRAHG